MKKVLILPITQLFLFTPFFFYTSINAMEESTNIRMSKYFEDPFPGIRIRIEKIIYPYPQDTLLFNEEMIETTLPFSHIGAASFSFSKSTTIGFLSSLKITWNSRRKGYGTRFLSRICTQLEQLGCTKVSLNAAPVRRELIEKLIAFYQRAGFQLDPKDLYAQRREPGALMYKVLSPQPKQLGSSST